MGSTINSIFVRHVHALNTGTTIENTGNYAVYLFDGPQMKDILIEPKFLYTTHFEIVDGGIGHDAKNNRYLSMKYKYPIAVDIKTPRIICHHVSLSFSSVTPVEDFVEMTIHFETRSRRFKF